MTSYAVVLAADENRMSAKTLQADNTEQDEVWWTISVKCLECQSGKLKLYMPFSQWLVELSEEC